VRQRFAGRGSYPIIEWIWLKRQLKAGTVTKPAQIDAHALKYFQTTPIR